MSRKGWGPQALPRARRTIASAAAAEADRLGEKLIAVSVWTPVVAPRNDFAVYPDLYLENMQAATEEVLALLEDTLAQAGSRKERILSVQIFLTDISRIGEMNAVWDKWVAKGHAPARATVEAKLASPGYGIEITAVAAKR